VASNASARQKVCRIQPMKMQPGKADERFVWEQLNNFFQKAHNDASFEILAAIAKHVGIGQLNGFPIDEKLVVTRLTSSCLSLHVRTSATQISYFRRS